MLSDGVSRDEVGWRDCDPRRFGLVRAFKFVVWSNTKYSGWIAVGAADRQEVALAMLHHGERMCGRPGMVLLNGQHPDDMDRAERPRSDRPRDKRRPTAATIPPLPAPSAKGVAAQQRPAC